MRIPNAHYLIIDLEATCSDDKSITSSEMEIIEIGAVMQNSRTFEIESEFQTFVKPVRHPELTRFCLELTKIRQSDVDAAPLFPQACEMMKKWMVDFPDALFCSWGNYDRNQFINDCVYHGVEYPFGADHMNLKVQFSKSGGPRKRVGIAGALKYLGLDFEGIHHRGIDDARNIARIVRRVCQSTSI